MSCSIVLKQFIFLIFFSFNPVLLINFIYDDYVGEKFPIKYLEAEEVLPTSLDLSRYLGSIKKTVDFIGKRPNNTDSNLSLSMYFVKALLKRTIQDYKHKMLQSQFETAKHVIHVAENYLSHYIYINKPYGWKDFAFRVSDVLRDDAPLVYSIGEFNRNRLTRWITGNGQFNNFTKAFDEATLPKELYVELVESVQDNSTFAINIDDSDWCLSSVSYNPVPVRIQDLKPCRSNSFCSEKIRLAPSVAYSLSHRLLNIMFLRHMRRCYMVSDVEDEVHMDILCASMYRETVYLARRGFFYRDLFLEHIALCGVMGYQEFHRLHWFNKAISWINQDGCIQETANFEINRTRLRIAMTKDPRKHKVSRKRLRHLLIEECHTHPMAVLVSALANGVRYAAHYMKI